ncbi:MAG: hypothetical protein H7Y38_15360 [Armatimonadetes bacterium]|nr:hypothetical protein [Armatimonadota bacterium]
MGYRLLFCASKGVLCGWWFLGLAVGGTFALNYPAFMELWRTVLLVLAVPICLAAPFAGVYVLRIAQGYWQQKRKPKLRGVEYADYAYIL